MSASESIVLQENSGAGPRARAEIDSRNGSIAAEDSLLNGQCRTGFNQPCALSDDGACFATKSRPKRIWLGANRLRRFSGSLQA